MTVPQTRQEIDGLRERRSELSNQLESAAERRAEIAEQIKSADGAVKSGLEQRMSVLDQRIVQLENDIAETGRQLTNAPSELLAGSGDPFTNFEIDPDLVEKVSIMFTLFVMAPIALAAAYLMFRRANRPAVQASSRGDGGERLQRLESSVDAIAVEIERISEGQRFVTKLLTEGSASSALAGRQGQHARIGRQSESE
ncbi:MAG: hypothetical protein M3365_09770 [Gemmatimonadota bacterium]|nr:hypothetical protein [Gemmatimonadota bacterium]